MPIHREVEIKCRVADVAAFARKLKKLQASPVLPASAFPSKNARARNFRIHEMNFLFDTPDSGFAKHGQLLRIRVESQENSGGKRRSKESSQVVRTIFTYKGPSYGASAQPAAQEQVALPAGSVPHLVAAGRHKVREEIEVEVADAAELRGILEALGMRAWFRYEKYRTTFRLPSSARWAKDLLIELDETPIGAFVELEGSAESIGRAAELLGYSPRNHITQSYLALHLEQCRARKIPPGDMLFPSQK